MVATFTPRANLWAKLILLFLGTIAVAILYSFWFWPRSDFARSVNWTVNQPVPFSHQHHVTGLGIDCRFCHTSVEVSSSAGLPPTYTCMTCHSQVWTNAAILAPVRDSLAADTPIVWNRVNDLPDYVYFNHSIHIAKGVGCASCHGDVAQMSLTYKAKTLTMEFCLHCHRNPAPNLRPRDKIYDTGWSRSANTPSPQTLFAHFHLGQRNLTDCSICHR